MAHHGQADLDSHMPRTPQRTRRNELCIRPTFAKGRCSAGAMAFWAAPFIEIPAEIVGIKGGAVGTKHACALAMLRCAHGCR